ncbi:TraB/GumN family protein [Pelagibius sp.]|uniref:TraB/GumN family protein n=1 Tax=Pelagibius sp. TaxID=1931238 RepID=UPI00262D2812|nr:TraB/GumN family protein [Pelagibius sp.]
MTALRKRLRFNPLLRPSLGFALLAVFLLLWPGFAAAVDPHAVRHGEGRLWRVERSGAPASHIMGTIHIADPRVRDLPRPILRAFKSSRRAAFELLVGPAERQEITTSRRLPQGRSLAAVLGRETYEKAVKHAQRYGLPEDAIEGLRPSSLAFLFQISPEEFRRQMDGDLVLDAWLIQYAYDLGMQVVALEHIEEQLSLLTDTSLEEEAEMLRQVLVKLEERPGARSELIDSYLAGNMSPVYQLVERMARENAEPGARAFKEQFLDARNRTMVNRMIPLLKQGRAFIAVGALHMPGDEGILHLLEQQGFRVTRVY